MPKVEEQAKEVLASVAQPGGQSEDPLMDGGLGGDGWWKRRKGKRAQRQSERLVAHPLEQAPSDNEPTGWGWGDKATPHDDESGSSDGNFGDWEGLLGFNLQDLMKESAKQRQTSPKKSGPGLFDWVVGALQAGDDWVNSFRSSGPHSSMDLHGLTLTTSSSGETYGPAIYGNPSYEVNVDLLLAIAGAAGKSKVRTILPTFRGKTGQELFDAVAAYTENAADLVQSIDELLVLAADMAVKDGEMESAKALEDKLKRWRAFASKPKPKEETQVESTDPDAASAIDAGGPEEEAESSTSKTTTSETTSSKTTTSSTTSSDKPATAYPNGLMPKADEIVVGTGGSARIMKKSRVPIKQQHGFTATRGEYIRVKFANGRSHYYLNRYPVKIGWERQSKAPVIIGNWKTVVRRKKNEDGSWSSTWKGHQCP